MKYVVWRDKIYVPSMEVEGTDGFHIPLEHLRLQLSSDEALDKGNYAIPTVAEMFKTLAVLKDTIFDTKYTRHEPTLTQFPTSQDLDRDYNAGGILVKDLNGNLVNLRSPAIDPTDKLAQEGDGLLFVLEQSGKFEVAGFQAGTWHIDNTQDQLPTVLAGLQADVKTNELNITSNSGRLDIIEAAESNFLLIDNKKEITSVGDIDETQTDDFTIAAREDVRRLANKLKVSIETDITQLDTKYSTEVANLQKVDSNFNSRIDVLEQGGTAAQYATAFRKFSADPTSTPVVDPISPTLPDGSTPVLPGSNSIIFDLNINADDGNVFTFGNKEDLTIWLKGTMDGTDLEMNSVIQAGKDTPQLIEILRGTNRQTLEVLTAQLSELGILTISRNEGTELDFSTVVVTELSEAILSATSGLVTQAQLTTEIGEVNINLVSETQARVTADNLKQDKIDLSLVDAQTDTVVTAINHNYLKGNNNEADIDELNLGKFDVKGDGTKITEIFDANGDIFTQNAQKLLLNDITSTDTAFLGHGYNGAIQFGYVAIGDTYISNLAKGDTSIAQAATGKLTIGSDQWKSGDGSGMMISGIYSASFEQLINLANAAHSDWVDYTNDITDPSDPTNILKKSYKTKDWSGDIGKPVRITYANGGATRGVMSGIINWYTVDDEVSVSGLEVNYQDNTYPIRWAGKRTGGNASSAYPITQVIEDLITFGGAGANPGDPGTIGNVQHNPNGAAPYDIIKFEIQEEVPVVSNLFGKFGDGTATSSQTSAGYSKGEVDPFRTVKDLTTLRTEDELFNAVEVKKCYMVSAQVNGTGTVKTGLLVIGEKTGAEAYGHIMIEQGIDQMLLGYILVKPGVTTHFVIKEGRLKVAIPNQDDDATTKKYVDDADTKIETDYKAADAATLASAHTYTDNKMKTGPLAEAATGTYWIGHNASGTISMMSDATGGIDIGSRSWSGTDGKGRLLHGAATALFADIIKAANGSRIKYHKGQILSFNNYPGGHFNDTNLFTKINMKPGYALLGTATLNAVTETSGSNKEHDHLNGFRSDAGDDLAFLYSHDTETNGHVANWNTTGTGTYTYPTGSSGGTANFPAGHLAIYYAYIAKKDITYAEME